MKKKLKKIYFLFWSLIFFAFSSSSTVAFEKLYQELDKSILQSNLKKEQVRLSIIFDSKIGDENIDRIKLKKTIATNIAKNYRLANPIATKQILQAVESQNTGGSDMQRSLDKNIVKNFFLASKTNFLILTELQEKEDAIIVFYRIFEKNGNLLGLTNQSFSRAHFSKQIAKPEKQPILLASTGNNLASLLAQQNLEDLFEQPKGAIDDFVNRETPFAENGNAWFFYLPTAYFPVRTHNLEVNFSVEDLRFAKISGESYRYFGGNSLFEFSTNLQTRNSSLYQGFVGIKAGIFQGDHPKFSFRLALGLRTLWQKEDSENDFSEDEASKEEERKKLRRLSFFVVTSGNLPSNNIIYNIYLDNYTIGGGIKYKLPHKIFLFVDSRLDYESEAKESFLALGFEHFPADTVGYALAYKTENRKTENSDTELEKKAVSSAVFGVKISF